jgi:hypothetical protein
MERLEYRGESAKSRHAFARYMADVARGKSGMQLQAVAAELTPSLRRCWIASSFTRVETPAGTFDALTCNIAYHFHKHGQKYGNVRRYTMAALRYYAANKSQGKTVDGVIKLDKGTFTPSGKIVTFSG